MRISEAVEFVYLCYIIVLSCCGDVEVDLGGLLVVLVDYGTDRCFKVEIDALIQLEVSERVHNPALYTDCFQFHCVLSQFGSHQ